MNPGKRASKWRIFKTICVIMLSLCLGLSVGIVGPTLVHLRYILNTDTQGIGMSFIGENIGTIVGALLAGILFDKLNQELQFGLACTVLGFCVTYAPWSGHLYVYAFVITVQNIAHGFIESSLQSYVLNLWIGRNCKGTILHIANTVETTGNFISPFMAIPFLSELPEMSFSQINTTGTQPVTNTYYNHTELRNYSIDNFTAFEKDTIAFYEEHGLHLVRYAYLTVTVPIVITTLMFFMTFLITREPVIRKQTRSTNSDSVSEKTKGITEKSQRKFNCSFSLFIDKYLMLTLVGIYIAVVMVPEYTFSIYLATFVIDGLKWRVKDGPLITSVFRGTQGLGQVLGIPLSLVLSPAKMLIINMVLGAGAFALMACVPHYPSGGDIIMWISAAISGLAVSTMYAGTILWGAQYVKVNAIYGATMVICTAIGGMSEVPLTGYLMQYHTHMWLVYLSLIATVFNIILFTVMHVIIKMTQGKSSDQERDQSNCHEDNKQQTENLL